MEASLTYLERDGSGPAALRLIAPKTDIRIPTHFIALIDVSESMSEDSKLDNVKHCMRLLLKCLTADDALSIITFGDSSEIILNEAKTDSVHRELIEKAIQSLSVNGSTNYSAGLGSVRQILESSSPLKPGLLTFTDGHANRGIFDSISLVAMITRIHEIYPSLSMAFVAYGTDHNATLLKAMADTVMGSYSIVDSLEGSATAMGDCLGGIISCVAQNIVIQCPSGSSALGPYTVSPTGRIVLGDIYSGVDTIILLEAAEGPFTISGVALPSLDPFTLTATPSLDMEPNVEISVTRLRYRCADLFKKIRDSIGTQVNFRAEIDTFREACANPALADHPVIAMLKGEILSMEVAIQNIAMGATRGLDTQLTQHAAFTGLLRGTTTLIGSRGRFNSSASDPEENPILTSPLRSTRQERMAETMRQSSLQAYENQEL